MGKRVSFLQFVPNRSEIKEYCDEILLLKNIFGFAQKTQCRKQNVVESQKFCAQICFENVLIYSGNAVTNFSHKASLKTLLFMRWLNHFGNSTNDSDSRQQSFAIFENMFN